MSKDMNFVALTGHAGATPETRQVSGKATVSFSLACNQSWKDESGAKKEHTDWVRLVAWGKLAEIIGEWVKKGSHIWINGRIQSRSYDDKEGRKVYVTEVVVREMGMLGKSEQTAKAGPGDEPPVDPSDLPF